MHATHLVLACWASYGTGLVSGLLIMFRAVREIPPPRAPRPQAPNVIPLRRR